MGGYVQISRIAGTLLKMAIKVWAYTGLVTFFCFLVYYMYGGFFAFTVLLFSALGILYHAQDNFLFYPELPSHSRVYIPNPSMFNLPYESVQVTTADKTTLHMYFIHQPNERQRHSPTIVFFHGNAGNMGHRLQNCVGLYHSLHCNILLVEYRGYGLSDGSPSEEGLYLDAKASLDYLFTRNDINHAEIVVFGRSLGGAIAIDLCIKEEYAEKIWCLIVENTFTSIPEMAKVLLRWRFLHYLPLGFYKNKFQSIYKVPFLKAPTLFISGLADTLVPPRMMSELHNKCGSSKKLLIQVPTGTHNETWNVQGYYHSLAEFLQLCRLNSVSTTPKKKECAVMMGEKQWNGVENI